MITKPMLASTYEGEELEFPVYATPKIDGIRALTIDSKLVSRTFKPIKNKDICATLSSLPDGIDGELVSGNFQQTTHRVMKETETEGEWIYYIFDYVKDSLDQPYIERIAALMKEIHNHPIQNIKLLLPKKINSFEELIAYEKECLDAGFEGLILRTANSPYKCGRATNKERYMMKLKRFSDAEAEIVGFVEYEHNTNVAEKDNFGRTKRSDRKEGKVLAGILGKFILKLPDGRTFGCGTGLSMAQRKEAWENQEKYLGQFAKYKHFEIGQKDLPRHPVFLGIRDPEDM